MSKIINKLNIAAKQKIDNKTASTFQINGTKKEPSHSDNNSGKIWILKSLFIILILTILCLYARLSIIMKDYASKINDTSKKIDELKYTINNNEHSISRLNFISEEVNLRIENNNMKIEELRKSDEMQVSVMETLAKAKNILLDKIDSLDTQINQLKEAVKQSNLQAAAATATAPEVKNSSQ